MALKRAVAARRKAETALIDSQVRESKSNGAMERAILKWQGQVRTMKLHLDEKIKMKISKNHEVIGWMFNWAAELP